MDITKQIATETGIKLQIAENIIQLIDDGNTIPFIARYRKELTGALDDQLLREFSERLAYLRNLEQRKAEVVSTIEELGKLSDTLKKSIEDAATLAEVEDLYRPYKQKRRTRASIARERGLEPLAKIIYEQSMKFGSIEELASPFIDPEKDVPDALAAIAGAKDIIAEDLSDSATLRKALRLLMQRHAEIASTASSEEDSVYSNYYEFSQRVSDIPSHRILAINRGEKEGFLKAKIVIDAGTMLDVIFKYAVREDSLTTECVKQAAEDSWQRLIFPSLDREIRTALTEKANEQAIAMFGQNLKPTLMQPPLKGRVVLGFDPAYRTGCKLAAVDETGKLLETAVIYPTPPNNKIAESTKKLLEMIEQHKIEIIAIGNGTASKESEIFVAQVISSIDKNKRDVSYAIVNEAGASVYSASKLGAQEFPEFDVSLRSAASIARRLQDPLAELVKIDPKAIGVGQYQHDMPVAKLDDTLSGVVEDCVNSVGVDINTASASLLGYVAGISTAVSKNIIAYREENGAFTARTQIKKVPKLGPKAFEQCAGFLRIPDAKNILDNTAVHPESYSAAKKLLDILGVKSKDISKGQATISDDIKSYGEQKAADECEIGIPTLKDIIAELKKPGRDVRDSLPAPTLRKDLMSMEDLKPGMELEGVVRNVIDFGAFIDIGVHQDGLVHISKMANKFIKHPSEVAKAGDIVTVWVESVDLEKKRISLSMVNANLKLKPCH